MATMGKHSIAVNYIYNMIYQVSLVILPLITSPYLSRVIGSEGLGNYSYSYSVAYYFFLFGMLGISNYGNRSIAFIREDKKQLDYVFSRIFYFQIISSGVSVICYLIYCLFFCKANNILAYVQILFVITAVFNIDWFFFGIEEFKITVIRKTLIKIFTSLCIFLFITSPDQLVVYTIILAGAELIGVLYLWLYLPRYVHFIRVPIREVFKDVKHIFVLFIPIVATSIYRYMDKIMIGQLWNMSGVGQYDYAEKIIMVCLGCMTALGTVMLPKMSNLIAKHMLSEVHKYLLNSMQFAILLASAISFGLASVGYRLAVLYYGSSYKECGEILVILSVTVIPIAWANVLRTQYLIPSAKDKGYVISVTIGAVINFLINLLLIPIWGLKGAVIGTISAEYIVAIIQSLYVCREIQIKEYIEKCLPFLIIGAVMYFVVSYIGKMTADTITGLTLQVMFGGLVYMGLSAIYCFISKNSIYQYFINYVHNRKKDH